MLFYTGNDISQDIETDFKPDLVWIKRRTSSELHAIYDSIRVLINNYQVIQQEQKLLILHHTKDLLLSTIMDLQ